MVTRWDVVFMKAQRRKQTHIHAKAGGESQDGFDKFVRGIERRVNGVNERLVDFQAGDGHGVQVI